MEEAKHFDDNKLALQWVLSMPGVDDVAAVGAYGAKKYGQNNWRGGSEFMRYAGSIIRHATAFIRGETLDKESGLPHLAHCAYNCLIILSWMKEGKGTDDRPQSVENDMASRDFSSGLRSVGAGALDCPLSENDHYRNPDPQ